MSKTCFKLISFLTELQIIRSYYEGKLWEPQLINRRHCQTLWFDYRSETRNIYQIRIQILVKLKESLQKMLWWICLFILSEVNLFSNLQGCCTTTVLWRCVHCFVQSYERNPEKHRQIDFVKMQKQHYKQSPNKAKLNILLFTSSTKACTIAHDIISAS